MKLSPDHIAVLTALYEDYTQDGDFCYLGFKRLALLSSLPREKVRRPVRWLARKGLAQYASGLQTEDGEFAGSGYACTPAGALVLELHQHAAKAKL